MINPVPQGFVGSNPTSSIESSVRCPKTEIFNLGKQHQVILKRNEGSLTEKSSYNAGLRECI